MSSITAKGNVVLVSRPGGKFVPWGMDGHQYTGGCGEEEGVLRHLKSLGHYVILYTHTDMKQSYDGGSLCDCVIVPEININRPKGTITADHQLALTAKDITAIKNATEQAIGLGYSSGNSATFGPVPLCHIMLEGVSYSKCLIGGPGELSDVVAPPQSLFGRAPYILTCAALSTPRISLIADNRSRPMEEEGWYMHGVNPIACFDQGDYIRDWYRKYDRWSNHLTEGKDPSKTMYKSYQQWGGWANTTTLPKHSHHIPWKDRRSSFILCHAHIGSMQCVKTRGDAWEKFLGTIDQWPEDFYIAGEGWEHWNYYREAYPRILGAVPQDACPGLIQQHICSPVATAYVGYYTSKPRVLLNNGCIPLLLDDNDGRSTTDFDPSVFECRANLNHPFMKNNFTWDPFYQVLPKDHFCRVKPGELWRKVARLSSDEHLYNDLLQELEELFQPRWDKFDELLSDLEASQYAMEDIRWLNNPHGKYFHNLYGGHRFEQVQPMYNFSETMWNYMNVFP